MSNSSHLPGNCMHTATQNGGFDAASQPAARPAGSDALERQAKTEPAPLPGPPVLTRQQPAVSPPLVRHTQQIRTYGRPVPSAAQHRQQQPPSRAQQLLLAAAGRGAGAQRPQQQQQQQQPGTSLQHVPQQRHYRHPQPGVPARRLSQQQQQYQQQQHAAPVRTQQSSPAPLREVSQQAQGTPAGSVSLQSTQEVGEVQQPRQIMLSVEAAKPSHIQQRQHYVMPVQTSERQPPQMVAVQASQQPPPQLLVQTTQHQQVLAVQPAQQQQMVAVQTSQQQQLVAVQTSQQQMVAVQPAQQQQLVSVQLGGTHHQYTLVSQPAMEAHQTHTQYSVVAATPPPPPPPPQGEQALLVVEAAPQATLGIQYYEAGLAGAEAAAQDCVYMVRQARGVSSMEIPVHRVSGARQPARGGGPGGAVMRARATSGPARARGRHASGRAAPAASRGPAAEDAPCRTGEPPPPAAGQAFDINEIAIEFEEPAVTAARCEEAARAPAAGEPVTSSAATRGSAQTLVEYVTAGQAGQTAQTSGKRPAKTRFTMEQYKAMKRQRQHSLDSPLQYVTGESGQRYQAFGRVASPILSGQLQANSAGKQLAAVIDRTVIQRGAVEPSRPAATSPGGGGDKPAEPYSPRLVAGKLAICANCGHSSSDFQYCDYCRKPLPASCKVIETAQSLAPASKPAEQPVGVIPVTLSATTYSRILAPVRTRGPPGRQSQLQPPPRIRRQRRRLTEEPECLTISSDEESPAPAPTRPSPAATPQSDGAGPRTSVEDVAAAGDGGLSGDELATRGVLGGGKAAADAAAAAAADVEPCWQRDLLSLAADGSLTGGYVSERPRAVRIGSYRPACELPVLFSEQGTQLRLPTVGQTPRTVPLTLPPDRVARVLAHFGPQLMVMFLYLTPPSGAPVRRLLGMTDASGPYFEPGSTQESHKRVTIIFEENLSEESRITLMQVFRNSLEEQCVIDINMAEANRILVLTSPPQMSLSLQTHHDHTVQTLLQFPPPPASGAIAVTTDDYCCLEEEQFLNDVIIDFYLKYLLSSRLAESDRRRTHVFSSFFYKRLTTRPSSRHGRRPAEDSLKLTAAEKRHARVKGWTKNVDIFDRDFLIVPINEHSHWFLAIICFPGLEGFRRLCDDQPCKAPEPRRSRTSTTAAPAASDPAPAPSPAPAAAPVSASAPASVPVSVPSQIGNTLIVPIQSEPVTEQLDDSDRDEAEGDDEDLDAEPDELDEPAAAADPAAEPAASAPGGSDGPASEAPASEGPAAAAASAPAAVSAAPVPAASETAAPAPVDGAAEPAAAGDAGDAGDAEDEFELEAPVPAVCTSDWPPTAVKQPCVLIFDSLAGASRSRVVATIRDYLRVEYSVKKGGQRPFSKDTIKGCCVKVPQQTNFSDCGVYVLQYVESFFQSPIQDFHVPLLPLPRWFPAERPRHKREQLARLIERLARRQNPDHTITLPRLLFNSAVPPGPAAADPAPPPAPAPAAAAPPTAPAPARDAKSRAVLLAAGPRQVMVARPAPGARHLVAIPKQPGGPKQVQYVALTRDAVLGPQTAPAAGRQVLVTMPKQAATARGRGGTPTKLAIRSAQHVMAPKPTSPAPKQVVATPPAVKQVALAPKPASPAPRQVAVAPKPASPGPKQVVSALKPASAGPKQLVAAPKPASPGAKQLVAAPKQVSPGPQQVVQKPASPAPSQSPSTPKPVTQEPVVSRTAVKPEWPAASPAAGGLPQPTARPPLRSPTAGSAATASPQPTASAEPRAEATPKPQTAAPGPAFTPRTSSPAVGSATITAGRPASVAAAAARGGSPQQPVAKAGTGSLATLADAYASDSDDAAEPDVPAPAAAANGTADGRVPPAASAAAEGPARTPRRGRPPKDYALMVGCKRRPPAAKDALRPKTPRKS